MHRPPHLRRRTLLKLGIGSAIVLAVAGSTIALMKPGLIDGKLSPSARLVLTRIAQGMLLGTLPADAGNQKLAIDAMLQRTDALLAFQPVHALAELSQLLTLMASAPGRRWLVGLSSSWEDATAAEVETALQAMRDSGVDLRIQAMQGLHDIVCLPYFSGDETWPFLGYPGPIEV
jgi:hypothetical protein